jgi:predicted nucleic acid-binding protein
MAGSKILLDTNALIYLDKGSETVAHFMVFKSIFLSVISEIELLSFPGLKQEKSLQLSEMLGWFTIVDIEPAIKRKAIEIRQRKKLKVPDAIIAATAIEYNMPILTADKMFSKIEGLNCVIFEV